MLSTNIKPSLLSTTPILFGQPVQFSSISTASQISSLFYRPQDQLFIYDTIAALATTAPTSNDGPGLYLYNNVDETKTTVIGHSFGDALLTAGGTINTPFLNALRLPPALVGLFTPLSTPSTRPGIKAFVLLAPWGNGVGIYGDAQMYNLPSLSNIKTPQLVIAGDGDDVAGYTGIVGLFKSLTNAPGKMMVTLKGAGHCVAMNPPPNDWIGSADGATYIHMADQIFQTSSNTLSPHFWNK
ncbi:hypothetical protein HDU76_003626 [Blyttiomyces sp. JEL0837]|nr:hypothetical protein HDU76_003626 [Blyttiomyces sp. JEL0837]